MAVAISVVESETFGGGSGGSGGPSFDLSIPNNSYVVCELLELSNSSPTFRTPTVGGVTMDSLSSDFTESGTGLAGHLYGLFVATGGTLTVEGGLSENFYQSRLICAVFTGTTSAPISDVTGFEPITSLNRSVTSATGDMAVAMLAEFGGFTFTPSGGTSSTTGTGVGTTGAFVLSKDGAGSVSITGTFSSTPGGIGFTFSVEADGGSTVGAARAYLDQL